MKARIVTAALALLGALAITPGTVTPVEAKDSGTVVRLDPQAGVVMLEGGRMYRVTAGTAISVDSKPVAFKTLQPGTRVAIENGEPVIYRDRRYIALKPVAPSPGAEASVTAPTPAGAQALPPGLTAQPSPAPRLTPPPPAPSAPAVATAPAPSTDVRDVTVTKEESIAKDAVLIKEETVTRPAVAAEPVRHTVYGTVSDVDRDGTVKIKTDRDSFEARLTPDALRDVKPGDTVVLDLSINPPGAASPR